jgi:hypothetical protein
MKLPEPTIIVDMDWCENQVYDAVDLIKYGRAEYLRGLEDAAKAEPVQKLQLELLHAYGKHWSPVYAT